MTIMATVAALAERIVAGGAITRDEACVLIACERQEDQAAITKAARRVFEQYHSQRADLCSLINAKSGQCSENCAFCAQSAHYATNVTTYALLPLETIIGRAEEAERQGSQRFCIVTSGGSLSDEEFARVLEAYRAIRRRTRLRLDGSLGVLSDERIGQLKEAGVTRINHNLETAERFFPSICTTHTFADRCATVRRLKAHGMEACTGGIIGLGETREDRVALAFALHELDVDCVPINILNPRPGTPLAHTDRLTPQDIVRTVAVFRLILPRPIIKLAGGREVNLGAFQKDALLAGANGIIIGGYLTTAGSAVADDVALLHAAGLTV